MSKNSELAGRLAAVENELLRVNNVVQDLQQTLAVVQGRIDELGALDLPSSEKAAIRERRKEIRQATNVQVRVVQSQQSSPFDACIHDFTPSGVGIKVELLVPVGTIITLAPPPSPNPQPAVEAVVCNHREDGKVGESGSRRWELGCQLLRRLSGQELSSFGLN